jgi:hypothetical protein
VLDDPRLDALPCAIALSPILSRLTNSPLLKNKMLRRAAEARRLAAASRNPAEKADLLDVAHRWLVLAGFHDSELEDGQLKNVAGR